MPPENLKILMLTMKRDCKADKSWCFSQEPPTEREESTDVA